MKSSMFERVAAFPEAQYPVRSTEYSAGYDLFCAEDTVISPHSIALIPTGVKCYLWENSWLMIALRSSTPKKKGLILANGIGIIDADYVDNPDNEGQIFVQVYNLTDNEVLIEKNERIAQGLVMPMSKLDIDNVKLVKRSGGIGSTK